MISSDNFCCLIFRRWFSISINLRWSNQIIKVYIHFFWICLECSQGTWLFRFHIINLKFPSSLTVNRTLKHKVVCWLWFIVTVLLTNPLTDNNIWTGWFYGLSIIFILLRILRFLWILNWTGFLLSFFRQTERFLWYCILWNKNVCIHNFILYYHWLRINLDEVLLWIIILYLIFLRQYWSNLILNILNCLINSSFYFSLLIFHVLLYKGFFTCLGRRLWQFWFYCTKWSFRASRFLQPLKKLLHWPFIWVNDA